MMKFQSILIKLIISFGLFFALVPLGSKLWGYGGHHVKFLFAVISYCITAYIFLNKTKSFKERLVVLVILLLPVSLLLVPLHIFYFNSARISLPSTIAHYVGAFAGLIVHYVSHKKVKVAIISCLLLFAVWVWFNGYNLYLHRLSFGSFFGSINERISDFKMLDSNNSSYDPNYFGDKLVLLDFWNTRCGICFKKFPQVQKQYEAFRNNPKVEVYGVNIPLKSDTVGQAQKIFDHFDHTFPVLYGTDDGLKDVFGVEVFPTVVVLENGREIIYRGNIEGATEVIIKKNQ